MKKRLIPHVPFLVVFTLFTVLGGAPSVAQGPDPLLATVTIQANQVSWQPHVVSAGFVLSISGPGDFYLQQTYQLGDPIAFGIAYDADSPLSDGVYLYELVSLPLKRPAEPAEEERGLTPAAEALVQTGSFSILGGSFVLQDIGSNTDVDPDGSMIADQVILDDLIVDGSACIGFDCVNGEAFGFDTIRLKENNLRIKFQDTSNTASFPSNDWQITANDSTNGGQNKFSIDDIDGGRTPFTIEAGARSHALYVENSGEVGIGTNNPVAEVHTVAGDTPTVRLEQNGSSGWNPQTWDVAGNETNFFIRDATNGSKLPFRIRSGAPTSSIDIASNGNVGIGTSSPARLLHILGPDGSVASPTMGVKDLLVIENNANANIALVTGADSTSGLKWIRPDGSFKGAIFYDHPDTQFEFKVEGLEVATLGTGGNMTIEGNLTQNSNFYSKENFEPLDPLQVLAVVDEMPITSWNFKADAPDVRHVGPMAQDFYEAFGLGIDEEHISPLDVSSVALVAIQGLNEVVQEKEAQINALEAQNTELEARLSALEQRLAPQPLFVTVLPWLLCGLLVLGLAIVAGKRLYATKG